MSLNLTNIANMYYQGYVWKQTKAEDENSAMDFSRILAVKGLENIEKPQGTANMSAVDVYMEHLKQKYGNVRIESVGRDQKSLDKIGKSMSGNDVVIAPNILEEMAHDSEKAKYYEGKIDHFFQDIVPAETARCAAMGLDFQACGVVIHEDGTVTYICGCADSPERVAEVNAINKAKRERGAAQRKASLERSQEAAKLNRQLMEEYSRKQAMAEGLMDNLFLVSRSEGLMGLKF